MSFRTAFLRLLQLFFLLPVFYLMQLNLRLYYRPNYAATPEGAYNRDVYRQQQFLKTALHGGAGARMQTLYPEGLLFSHALYGLTWCQLLEDMAPGSSVYAEGMDEINWALASVHTPEARQPFTQDLPLAFGAFYTGWTTYLLGQKLHIQPPSDHLPSDKERFQAGCDRIAAALAASPEPYLASYAYGTWPADNAVCLAALALHDRLFEPAYAGTIDTWFRRTEPSLDSATGLLPHAVFPWEGPRGSSQSLLLYFLAEIDSAYAAAQAVRYREIFVDTCLGVPGIREYPRGTFGRGDVDSGPVLLGFGGAATIVGMAALSRLGDASLAGSIRGAVEGLGCPVGTRSEKRYFFGQLEMADVFIAWAQSAMPEQKSHRARGVYWAFHSVSLLAASIWLGLYFLMVFWLRRT